MPTVPIETDRLPLRPLDPDDLDELVSLHADPETARFIRPLDREVAEARIRHDRLGRGA